MRWVAACMILIGFLGLGCSLVYEKRQHIEQLLIQRHLLYLMQGEMEHFYRPLSEIFLKIADKMPEPYEQFLHIVADKLQAWNGDSLDHIWTNELMQMSKEYHIPERMLNPVAHIVKNLHYEDREMQIQAIVFAREEIEELAKQKKQELMKNQKCTLWLCGMAGLLCIIIFL